MRVLKPSKNRLTGGYSKEHKGYDYSGRGDQNYYSSFHGVVVQSKNSETKNWVNEGTKTTADYGNYIKIKANVDGKTIYQLGAHFKAGTVLPQGTEVKKGQVVAQVGNTGNSTGDHSHTEYRDDSNTNFAVEFTDEMEEPNLQTMELRDKKQEIIDAYKAITGEYPNDDEITMRLQQDKNRVELAEDILRNDGRSKPKWLKEWNVEDNKDIDWQTTAEQYQRTNEDLKDLLGLGYSANTEEIHGTVQGLIQTVKELKQTSTPKVVYKYLDKEYEKIFESTKLNLLLAIGGVTK